jgi:hypothetical protein
MPTDNVIRMENGKVLGAAIPKTIDYSFEEHIIGTWVDGSTLYEKTIDCGALPNSTQKLIDPDISNLNKIIELKGFAIGSSYNDVYPLPFAGPATTDNVATYFDGTNIKIRTATNFSTYNGYVTLRYTKTN